MKDAFEIGIYTKNNSNVFVFKMSHKIGILITGSIKGNSNNSYISNLNSYFKLDKNPSEEVLLKLKAKILEEDIPKNIKSIAIRFLKNRGFNLKDSSKKEDKTPIIKDGLFIFDGLKIISKILVGVNRDKTNETTTILYSGGSCELRCINDETNNKIENLIFTHLREQHINHL